jgi:hypothetical protein
MGTVVHDETPFEYCCPVVDPPHEADEQMSVRK